MMPETYSGFATYASDERQGLRAISIGQSHWVRGVDGDGLEIGGHGKWWKSPWLIFVVFVLWAGIGEAFH